MASASSATGLGEPMYSAASRRQRSDALSQNLRQDSGNNLPSHHRLEVCFGGSGDKAFDLGGDAGWVVGRLGCRLLERADGARLGKAAGQQVDDLVVDRIDLG